MRMTAMTGEGIAMIESYGKGGFRISGQWHEGSVLIHQDRVFSLAFDDLDRFPLDRLDEMFAESANHPQILLIGCGSRFRAMPQALRQWAEKRGISADIMDTGAAARTYNVLRQEDRLVAAALVAVD